MRYYATLILIICIQPLCAKDALHQNRASKQAIIHVFIHGATQIQLTMLSPLSTILDRFSGNSWYERALLRARTDPQSERSALMLGLGLQNVTAAVVSNTLPEECNGHAAYHMLRAFHRLKPETKQVPDRELWFTFGWLGIFSAHSRLEVATHLYNDLYSLQTKYRKKGYETRIKLYTFSHGGLIALLLPAVERIRNTKLDIDLLILSATPLYADIAEHLLSGMFTRIVNFYSRSDWVQTVDPVSIPKGPCYQTLTEICKLSDENVQTHRKWPQLIDAHIAICGRNICNHQTFFNLNNFIRPRVKSRRSHTYLSRRRRRIVHDTINIFHPLPLLIFYPILNALMEYKDTTTSCAHFDIDFTTQGHNAGDKIDTNPQQLIISCHNTAHRETNAHTLSQTPYIAFIPRAPLLQAQKEIQLAYGISGPPTSFATHITAIKSAFMAIFS